MAERPRASLVDIETPLTYDDVAKLLRVEKTTLRRMVAEGDWPAPFKIGKQPRWLPSTVKEFLAAIQAADLVQRVKKAARHLEVNDSNAKEPEATEGSEDKPAGHRRNLS
jgi:excisionase family DNA binding protein